MTIAVTLDAIRPILRDLGAEPVALAAMAGGSAAVFRVDCADGMALVLKTYPDDRPWKPGKDAYAASLLRDLDVPVTRWLTMDESKTRLPVRFAVTTYLPGKTADALKGEPGIEDVYRQMGALAKRLHAVRMEGYGAIDARGLVKPVASHGEYMRAVFADSFRRFRDLGGDVELARRLERVVDERFDLVTHSAGAVFAHDDLHPGNVLAARDARGALKLTGLIDFGNVRAADAVYDLAKNLFCSAHMDPRSTAAMREGYGAIDHPDPEGALWLYTLLHRVMMWWWLRGIGAKADEGSLPGLIRDLAEMAG